MIVLASRRGAALFVYKRSVLLSPKLTLFITNRLGFASGAMVYVSVFELWPEAREELKSNWITGGVAGTAAAVMLGLQLLIKEVREFVLFVVEEQRRRRSETRADDKSGFNALRCAARFSSKR